MDPRKLVVFFFIVAGIIGVVDTPVDRNDNHVIIKTADCLESCFSFSTDYDHSQTSHLMKSAFDHYFVLGLGFLAILGYVSLRTWKGKIKECATDIELDLNLNPLTFWEPKSPHQWNQNNDAYQVHKLLKGWRLVSLPVKNYKKDWRLVNGMQRGTIGLGAHLAGGVHAIIVQAGDIISTTPPNSVPRPIQTRSSQPKDACQGIQQVIVNDEDSHSHEISYDVSSDDDISKKFVSVLEPTRPLWEDVFPYQSYELKDSLPSWVYRMDSLPSWARMDLPLELELEIAKLFPKARWIDEARLPWRPTSFVPVFEQKQCQGRRDISVKALLAARAAKRREDEKENERKKKKETFRIEIARRKKEKMEIKEKKRQLEEKQKTEADVAFRNVLHEKCIKVDALEAARDAKRREEEKENERKKKKEAFKIKIATLKKEKLEQSKKQKENEIKIKNMMC